MTEAELQTAVIDLAHTFQWTVAHFRPARTKHGWATPVAADGKGFPDLVLVHPDTGVLWRELKTDRGQLTPDQQRWATTLVAAGQNWALWRPRDWDTIVDTLTFGKARST